MLELLVLAAAQTSTGPGPIHVRMRASRFERVAPLPTLPSVLLDVYGNGFGVAQQTARARNLQARILWVDATANLNRVNTREKVVDLVRKAKDIGFNTIVFDVKPIVGYTLYPSRLTGKLQRWRDQHLPLEFDPLRVMADEAIRQGIPLFVSMNAFSEGHRMAKQAYGDPDSPFGSPGPGFRRPDEQTVLYEPVPVVVSGDRRMPVALPLNSWPADGGSLGAFKALRPLGRVPEDAFGVAMNGEGRVWARYDAAALQRMSDQGWLWEPPNVEPGSTLLVGRGEAAAFLREHGYMRAEFEVDSKANFVRISERLEQQIPLMMNPHHPEVRRRALAFIEEVMRNYPINGVIFDDRLRFGGKNADFSELTRAMFEERVGERLRWPEDVFTFTFTPSMETGIRPGRWHDAWMAWRAETLTNWVAEAAALTRSLRPGAQFGIYAGSWFGDYAAFGANYSAQEFDGPFPFMTAEFRRTGFAHHLDFLITGCYYPVGTIAGAMERGLAPGRTVESAGQLTNRAARDQTWAYAGIMLQHFFGNPERLKPALQAAVGSTQGVMVFDLSHRFEQFEPILRRAFRQPAKPPHADPELILDVRRRRAMLDRMGVREPPVFIRQGTPGAGH
jgi:uncharacterized lipoprotein YddW (UPF0748 family)